jgi:hypothetical protein
VIHGRLPAVEGALFVEAIEAARAVADAGRGAADAGRADAHGADAEPLDAHAARRADALARVAESFLQHKSAALRTADRFQVVVHVDAETLREGVAGRAEIEGGPSLAAEKVRRLANLVSLCRFHHRSVHEAGYTIETRVDGTLRFRRPDGRDVTTACCGPETHFEGRELEAAHAHFEPAIDARTADCLWNGGRMDYDLAVWALSARAQRANARTRRRGRTARTGRTGPTMLRGPATFLRKL